MFRSEIKEILAEASGVSADLFSLDIPPRFELGDYSTNVALKSVGHKEGYKSLPQETAGKIAEKISALNDPLIHSVSVAGGGFINISLSDSAKQRALQEILEKGEEFGESSALSGKKIQVEFISANPTGPLTLANGRGGFFGDVLSRILASQGAVIEREYYVNDAGNQVRLLGLSVLAASGRNEDSEEYYHGDHLREWAKKNPNILEAHQRDPELLGRYVARDFLESLIKPSIAKMGVHFDRWTSEHADIREKKYIEQFLERARQYVYEAEGARWLKTTEFGDDKNRVLVTSDNFPTYFLADAGHHLEGLERGWSQKINIVGADHHGYVSRIQAVAKIIGLSLEMIVMQLVRLTEDGKEVRMSKRKGVYVTIDELIDEAGLDAVRYFFLEKNPETHIDFNLKLAKTKSKENPVFYVQYAHARLASIFRKNAGTAGDFNFSLLRSDSEQALLRRLLRFSEILEDIARDYRVARLIHYAYDLAHGFHLFYETQRILDAAANERAARVALASATQIVLRKTLSLLGISAPESM